MNDLARKRLLVAIREDNVPLSQALLGDGFDVMHCHALDVAKQSLGGGIDMVVAGIHCDNGAVFELLQHVRSSSAHAGLPFFILLDTSQRYDPASFPRTASHAAISVSSAWTGVRYPVEE